MSNEKNVYYYNAQVKKIIDGDTFFPKIDSSDFTLSNEVTHAAHEKHAYGFSFQTWLRK